MLLSAVYVLMMIFLAVIAIYLITYGTKYGFTQLYLAFTKPWENKDNNVLSLTFTIHTPYEHGQYIYHRVNDVWYEDVGVSKSWDEARIKEPVGKLLTLILEDYDNFIYRDGGLNFGHTKLPIKAVDDKVLELFGSKVLLTYKEAHHIVTFLSGIKFERHKFESNNRLKELEEERANNTDRILENINNYLLNKEK